jgi:hypothetical protein
MTRLKQLLLRIENATFHSDDDLFESINKKMIQVLNGRGSSNSNCSSGTNRGCSNYQCATGNMNNFGCFNTGCCET